MQQKHSNIAIFVPHNGCPHQCTFCNQREITGQTFQPHYEDVSNAVKIARESLGEKTKTAEIAFFGGSFTAIDRDYMIELLSAAHPYVSSGEFHGIRISTRPDAIDDEILEVLSNYGVTAIELGAQSMDDKVLLLNKRGHTSEDVEKASELIHEYRFSLGLQMMTALYGSSDRTDKETARKIAELNPDTVRIYPTVVMKGTELYRLYTDGEYEPQTVGDAIELCSELLSFFEGKGINVIRLGLHDSESLRMNMAAGAFHPALREMCESRIILKNTFNLLKEKGINSGTVEFTVSEKSVSRFIGQKKCNLKELEKSGITAIIKQSPELGKYEVRIS